MLIQFENFKNFKNHIFDILIVGCGPAGIELAKNLSPKLNIAMIDIGSLTYNPKTHEIYKSKEETNYDAETSRLPMIGGSSNHWEGQIRPLNFDQISFYFKNKENYNEHLIKTSEIFKVKDKFYKKRSLINNYDEINFFVNNLNFKERFKKLNKKKIKVFKNALVYNFKQNEIGFKIYLKSVNNLENFTLLSKKLILAGGGIENARLLRNYVNYNNQRILNYGETKFVEHPSNYNTGKIIISDLINFDSDVSDKRIQLSFLNNQLNNNFNKLCIIAGEFENLDITFKDKILNKNLNRIRRNKKLYIGNFWTMMEQQSNTSKIEFYKRNKFNLPEFNIFWNLESHDKDLFINGVNEFGKSILASEMGLIKFDYNFFKNKKPRSFLDGGAHHMSTTPGGKNGIVDKNFEVRNIKNLYITGSSIFYKSGYQNPTFTIVMLSSRLAQIINDEF